MFQRSCDRCGATANSIQTEISPKGPDRDGGDSERTERVDCGSYPVPSRVPLADDPPSAILRQHSRSEPPDQPPRERRRDRKGDGEDPEKRAEQRRLLLSSGS